MEILYVIPARGGSKGIPYKNIKNLGGKPLICHTIDVARELSSDENICVSTDDEKIINIVEGYGLEVPFIRPGYLASDTATTNDVLIHAITYYEKIGRHFDILVLLQPTSPFRKAEQVKEALSLFSKDTDMVVSVRKAHSASVLCNETSNGYLDFTINKDGARRQDLDKYYELNGAIYVINVNELKKTPMHKFSRRIKYVMDDFSSLDIDTLFDWFVAERLVEFNHSF